MTRVIAACIFTSTAFFIPNAPAYAADQSVDELAKIVENPFADLISVPFQLNVYPNSGPAKKTVSILEIQPIIPLPLNDEWVIISRTIAPVIWEPRLYQGGASANGLGDIEPSMFLSPKHPGKWIWGAGVITQMPTHTDSLLGNDHWGIGPTAAAIHIDPESPWVYGALINQVFSQGSAKNDPTYSHGFVQPALAYNFKGGTYLVSQPVISYDWKAAGGQKWVAPLGGGIGQIVKIGKLPMNLSVAAYYNVVRPDAGPHWQAQFTLQFLFPEK